MRTLNFIVNEQILKKDPSCDFSGMVSGTKGYYQASFAFSRDWRDLKRVAVFRSRSKTLYEPIVNGKCKIPDEILESVNYWVSVMGKNKEYSYPTNEVIITQKRGA